MLCGSGGHRALSTWIFTSDSFDLRIESIIIKHHEHAFKYGKARRKNDQISASISSGGSVFLSNMACHMVTGNYFSGTPL